jgi:hypothetical protein
MNHLNRRSRPRLADGRRRIAINVNLSPDVLKELKKLGNGNRSAAIEELVAQYLDRARQPETVT